MKKFKPNKISYQDNKITKFIINCKKLNNPECIIDTEDYEKIKNYKWNIKFQSSNKKISNIYYKNKKIHKILHQVIMNDVLIDHIDGNILNNSKSNLRKCTHTENMRNRSIHLNNKSGYKGVYKHALVNKWVAQIDYNKNHFYLGIFENELSAAEAYNKAALKYHGEFARLNKI